MTETRVRCEIRIRAQWWMKYGVNTSSLLSPKDEHVSQSYIVVNIGALPPMVSRSYCPIQELHTAMASFQTESPRDSCLVVLADRVAAIQKSIAW